MKQSQTSTLPVIKCRWDAYKSSGKWYAGQEIDLPGELQIQSSAAVREYIRTAQSQIVASAFDEYYHVIRETDAQSADPDYHGFMNRLLLLR